MILLQAARQFRGPPPKKIEWWILLSFGTKLACFGFRNTAHANSFRWNFYKRVKKDSCRGKRRNINKANRKKQNWHAQNDGSVYCQADYIFILSVAWFCSRTNKFDTNLSTRNRLLLSSQGVFSGCGKGERFELTNGGLTGWDFDGKAKDASPWNGTLLGEILWNEPAGKTQLTRPRHSWMLKWLFKK